MVALFIKSVVPYTRSEFFHRALGSQPLLPFARFFVFYGILCLARFALKIKNKIKQ